MDARQFRRHCAAFACHYVHDIVYAANDGIITTFAVIAGVRGARLNGLVVLVLGFANLAADGLSMGVGDYLGIKSQRAAELREGFREWHETVHAAKHGVVTWGTFLLAGVVPLLAFLTALPVERAFWLSAGLTAAALFVVGALRTGVTHRCAWRSGLEMLLVGALAGAAAFLAGMGVRRLVTGR